MKFIVTVNADEKTYDWNGEETKPDYKFTVHLNEHQQSVLEKYPKLIEHLKTHISQDVEYYFNEYLRKDLSNGERKELDLPDDRDRV